MFINIIKIIGVMPLVTVLVTNFRFFVWMLIYWPTVDHIYVIVTSKIHYIHDIQLYCSI